MIVLFNLVQICSRDVDGTQGASIQPLLYLCGGSLEHVEGMAVHLELLDDRLGGQNWHGAVTTEEQAYITLCQKLCVPYGRSSTREWSRVGMAVSPAEVVP